MIPSIVPNHKKRLIDCTREAANKNKRDELDTLKARIDVVEAQVEIIQKQPTKQ